MADVTPEEQVVDLDDAGFDEPTGAGLDAVNEQLIARLAGRARAAGWSRAARVGCRRS